MKKYIVEGIDLPILTAPISHAVVANGTCYVSGQLSVDQEGKYIAASVAEEAERSFKNVFAVLRAAQFEPEDLVFIDIAFSDLRDLPIVNNVVAAFFPAGRRPARTIYQAAALPYGAKIKVMGVAIRS
jgi:reactive intermediate/imine deaminase